MSFKIVRNILSFLWLKANRRLQGNIYMGKNVGIETSARLVTEDVSTIIIEDNVSIGSRCKILARKGSKVILRRKVTVHSGTEIITKESRNEKGGCIEIGECSILAKNNRVDISGNVYIGEQVRTGEGCFIHTHTHIYDKPGLIWTQGVMIGDVKIGRGCWIGTNVQIMPGVTIGEGAIIAAGSIVTEDVESFTVVGGVPAREIKRRFKTGS